MNRLVEVRSLRVVRGERVVLRDLDCVVRAGKVTGLLGPSGSGKTTLLRSIVGVQKILSGRVSVLGEPAGSPRLRSRVAYVTQAPSVYDDLTVEENLRFFAHVLAAPRSQVAHVVDTVKLAEHGRHLVGRLSGGERARVSLATALLGEPEVLVLDEPTVGLDPVLRRDLWNVFHELAAAGKLLLVSSHVMDEAERCDELLLLREGRLIASESPGRLRDETGSRTLDEAFLRLAEEEPGGR